MRSFQFFLLAFLALMPLVSAVKFAVESKPKGHPPRCIRDFVNKGKMVVVKITTSGERGDGQVLNLHVSLDQAQAIIILINSRFTTIKEMNMAARRILRAKSELHSLLMTMLLLMSALKTSLLLIDTTGGVILNLTSKLDLRLVTGTRFKLPRNSNLLKLNCDALKS